MGECERDADQRQKGARHAVREQPHRRRKRQAGGYVAEMSEIPNQMVDAHADERGPARDVDRRDASELGRLVR